MEKKGTPVVLVTGGSRGLGRGIAVHCAKLGLSVAVNYAGNVAAAAETLSLCDKVRQHGDQRFLSLQADIGEGSARQELLEETLSRFGRIDALVNNAGKGPSVRADITETTVDSFEEVLRVNLEGPFFLSQSVANFWLKKKQDPLLPGGYTIIFISSISASTVSLNRAEYCISKAGLSMAAQAWAVRLAGEAIQVYELRPGIMRTDMTAGVKEKYEKLFAEGLVPQGRWGEPEDVGRAVGSLLMGDFPYSIGSVIYLDGGFHLRRL
jgi:3-oxoacyl-[acyl-carrier protein] reductase